MKEAPRLAKTRWLTLTPGAEFDDRFRVRGEALQVAWGTFLGQVPWQSLVTLTFDPKRVFPVSRDVANHEAFRWCGDLGRATRRPVAWAYGTERGHGGQWHAHVLTDASSDALKAPLALWEARNGRSDVQGVYDVQGAARYVSKQASLDGELVLSDTCLRYLKGQR